MTTLEWLYLSHTAVTDAGLGALRGLQSLEELWLDNTAVTDAGVRQLVALPSLRRLHVVGTRITVDGLLALRALPLRLLEFNPRDDASAARLRDAFPECEID